MSGRKTRRPGEIAIPPGSGIGKGHTCTCWPKPGDARPCTAQTCDWRCRACRSYGRPFYSRDDLQYMEQGTGPLAAQLARLWRAKGAMNDGLAHEPGAMACYWCDALVLRQRGAGPVIGRAYPTS